jgi:hypothetical protein
MIIDSFNKDYGYKSFTISAAETNLDIKTTYPDLFDFAQEARYCRIVTDKTITVRFNDVSNPAIQVTAAQSPRVWNRIEHGLVITNMFITNPTVTTAITIELYQ